ncbi:MAG: hypothetical protein QOI67_1591 [Gaiellaceae bacterium]|jgi:hypothetical protein|nr:hypothetical protein [Gaiellaceae bacterium]
MRDRSWRTVAAIGGLLGLVGVVAVAAAGRSPGGGESRPSADAPQLLADYLSTIALLMVPAGALLLFFAMFVRRGYAPSKGGRRAGGSRSFVMAAVVLGAVLIIVHQGVRFGWINRDNPGQNSNPTKVVPGKPGKIAPPPQPQAYRPQFRWLPALVVGSLIVGIGGAMTIFAVRRRRELLRDAPIVEALSDVLAETLDDLRGERDPRQAVIRAYSRMERTMAARGLPRHEAEAPLEYLGRVLDAVQASSHSVRRLTQLFQRARFSKHDIDSGMKEDAIEALSGLRAELEVAR